MSTRRLSRQVTFANVVSLIALFCALGLGTAWALDANSVRSQHIVNGEVKEPDLAKQSVSAEKLALGARQYAHVGAQANIIESRGVVDVEEAVSGAGVYCIDLKEPAKVGVASTDAGPGIYTINPLFAKVAIPAETSCGEDANDASVRVMTSSSNSPEHPFFVIFM